MVCDSLNSGIIIISNQIVFSNMQSDKKINYVSCKAKLVLKLKLRYKLYVTDSSVVFI